MINKRMEYSFSIFSGFYQTKYSYILTVAQKKNSYILTFMYRKVVLKEIDMNYLNGL